jgi:hypothetical protein
MEASVTDRILDNNTTRRNLLKLAGAAALGAAGVAAAARRAHAAGSGTTLDQFWNPQHLVDTRGGAKLGAGAEVVLGPFPVPGGGGFMSDDYYGLIGNLTATGWTGRGWLSVRPSGMPFDPVHGAILLHFGGKSVGAVSNFFVVQFGFPTVAGKKSDGKIVVHNGGPGASNLILDMFGFTGPDQ